MFDNLRVLMPIDGLSSHTTGWRYQTKSLGCTYDAYEILEDGTLWLLDARFENGRARIVNLRGDILFNHNASDWRFRATFENGLVTSIFAE